MLRNSYSLANSNSNHTLLETFFTFISVFVIVSRLIIPVITTHKFERYEPAFHGDVVAGGEIWWSHDGSIWWRSGFSVSGNRRRAIRSTLHLTTTQTQIKWTSGTVNLVNRRTLQLASRHFISKSDLLTYPQ